MFKTKSRINKNMIIVKRNRCKKDICPYKLIMKQIRRKIY